MRKVLITKRLYRMITTPVDVSITIKDEDGEPHKLRDTVLCYPYADNIGELLEISVDDNTLANYFDIRDGFVTYQTSEPDLNENGKWKREGRQIMKMSKFLNMLRNDFKTIEAGREKLINRAIELISTKSQAKTDSIMVSDNIGHIYQMETASEGTGTLGGSCMRPESCSSGNQYVSNYNTVRGLRIAYMTKENNLIARALLWHDVKDNNGNVFKFMDRIYGTESNIESFKEWAFDNGYFHKVDQSYSNETLINSDGLRIKRYRLEDAFQREPEYMPYVDTMCNYSADENRLYCYGTRIDDEYYCLQNTDGEMEPANNDEDYFYCESCGSREHNDNSYYMEDTQRYLCESCAGSYLDHRYIRVDGYYEETVEVMVSGCSYTVPTDWDYSRYDLIYIEDRDQYYHIDDTFCCDVCGDCFHIDDSIGHDDHYLCEYCYNEVIEMEKKEAEELKAEELEIQIQ